jgi:hypothetical protein
MPLPFIDLLINPLALLVHLLLQLVLCVPHPLQEFHSLLHKSFCLVLSCEVREVTGEVQIRCLIHNNLLQIEDGGSLRLGHGPMCFVHVGLPLGHNFGKNLPVLLNQILLSFQFLPLSLLRSL